MDPGTRSMLKVTLPVAYEDRQPSKGCDDAHSAGLGQRRHVERLVGETGAEVRVHPEPRVSGG